jgi:ankyrin repeat protein
MQLVGILLHAGASCNARNLKGQTPLHIAVLAQSSTTLLQMIEYGARKGRPQPQQVDISAQDAMGCSPLHIAAYIGHADSCRALLQYGGDPLQMDNSGKRTSVHLTALWNWKNAAIQRYGTGKTQPYVP